MSGHFGVWTSWCKDCWLRNKCSWLSRAHCIRCLLQIHTPTSYKAQQLCAECLGLLGAVDPARVAVTLDPPEALCRSTQDLLVILITRHLVRLLRVASHILVLDAASLAIQVCSQHVIASESHNLIQKTTLNPKLYVPPSSPQQNHQFVIKLGFLPF